MSRPRMLGVLLCYNDGDLLEEAIGYLRSQHHEIVVWDHGSTDQTADVIRRLRGELIEATYIPREFDFYELYPAMSRHLMENYTKDWNWISWPDQDEFLEGPSRSRPYWDWIAEMYESPYSWIEFQNYVFWHTSADGDSKSVVERVRHYALRDYRPRLLRSWRASCTNIRRFNHNPPEGDPSPVRFKLRHYPMRSAELARRRVLLDRAGLRRGNNIYHYDNMKAHLEGLEIQPGQLHYDDGSELNPEPIFEWRSIYGTAEAIDH